MCQSFITGWSNFCTLVGHFSKLFEFAGLSRLNTYFRPKIIAFSKKKKKSSLDRQDLCKIVPRARSWTTLFYNVALPAEKIFIVPKAQHRSEQD